MLKITVLIATAISLSAGSHAQINKKEYAKCAVIKGDLERLECFDSLTEDKKLDGPQSKSAPALGNGKWDVSEEVNPIDDSETVTLVLLADSGKSRWGKKAYLVARCKSNTTDLYMGWNDYLGREADVLTRVGGNKAITQRWSLSTDKKATFHPKPIHFIKEMLSSSKVVAQVTPYNENPITAVFDTTGLENAIKPLRKTCGWQSP